MSSMTPELSTMTPVPRYTSLLTVSDHVIPVDNGTVSADPGTVSATPTKKLAPMQNALALMAAPNAMDIKPPLNDLHRARWGIDGRNNAVRAASCIVAIADTRATHSPKQAIV